MVTELDASTEVNASTKVNATEAKLQELLAQMNNMLVNAKPATKNTISNAIKQLEIWEKGLRKKSDHPFDLIQVENPDLYRRINELLEEFISYLKEFICDPEYVNYLSHYWPFHFGDPFLICAPPSPIFAPSWYFRRFYQANNDLSGSCDSRSHIGN
jgi:hypothetical protein